MKISIELWCLIKRYLDPTCILNLSSTCVSLRYELMKTYFLVCECDGTNYPIWKQLFDRYAFTVETLLIYDHGMSPLTMDDIKRLFGMKPKSFYLESNSLLWIDLPVTCLHLSLGGNNLRLKGNYSHILTLVVWDNQMHLNQPLNQIQFPKLTSLEITDSCWNQSDFECFSSSPLKQLTLENNAIHSIYWFNQLEKLSLQGPAFQFHVKMPFLKEFEWKGSFTPQDLANLIKAAPFITHLTLNRSECSDFSIIGALPLTYLDCKNTNFNDDQLQILSPQLSRLITVDFSSTYVSDRGIKTMLKYCSRLKKIILDQGIISTSNSDLSSYSTESS